MKLSAEMKQQLSELQNEAKELMKKDGVTAQEITNKAKEIETLKAKIAMQEEIEEDEKLAAENAIKSGQMQPMDGSSNGETTENEIDGDLEVKAFAKAIAKKSLSPLEAQALSSNTDADGNLLIPKDLKTEINRLEREHKSLRELVTVIPVSTKEGHRILEKDAKSTGFTDIEELTDLPDLSSPQWEKVDYKIRDLGGLLPIPNHLLEDETGGLLSYLAQWFVDKKYATDNKLLLFDDGAKGTQGIIGTALEDNSSKNVFIKEVLAAKLTFQKLKTVLNKGFPRPIAVKAKIVTNQDGLDILDSMEDKNGRPYLTGDGTEEFPYKFKGRVVDVYDNDTLPNDTTDQANPLVPFIVGDLKKGVVLFDRKQMSVATSKEAGFKNNSTIMRGIVRQDNRIWDKKAAKVIYSPLS